MTAVVKLGLERLEHVFKVDPSQVVGEDAHEGVPFKLIEDLRAELFECDVVLRFPTARIQFVLLKTIETEYKSHNLKRFFFFLSKRCRVESSMIAEHIFGEEFQAKLALHIRARHLTLCKHLHLRNSENLGAQLTKDCPHADIAVKSFSLLLLIVGEEVASLATLFQRLTSFLFSVGTWSLLRGFRTLVSDRERLALLLVSALAQDR